MTHFHSYAYLGIFLIFAGLVIRYQIAKRKFSRRGPAGLEYFSSYKEGLITRFVEGIGRFFGFLFIMMGILLILAAILY
jgi:hypothetical protein